jgi:signal transduction histidine kinase
VDVRRATVHPEGEAGRARAGYGRFVVARLRAYSDWLVIGGILAAGVVDLLAVGEDFQGSKAANALLIVACVAPLYWRRSAPVLTLFAVIAASSAGSLWLYGVDQQGPIEPWLSLLVALYSLGAYEPRRRVIRALAVAMPIVLAQSIVSQIAGMAPGDVWPPYLFYAIAVGTGRAMRHYRGLTAELRERTVELEHEREERARLAVLEERSRMARELHDVIAHSVSVIVVQAAAERRALPDGAESTGAALEQIERTGREALVELRRLLGVLRRGEDDAPARAPQPGLAVLDELVAQVRDAGLSVDVRIEGDPTALPPGVDLSAYRIVQEALTNALKHAHARRAEVVLGFGTGELRLDVRDDGRGNGAPVVPGGGHGLAGMRERAQLYGGELAAGRRVDGPGFEVKARIPW